MSEGDFTTGYYDPSGRWIPYGSDQTLSVAQQAGIQNQQEQERRLTTGGFPSEGDFTTGYYDPSGRWIPYGAQQPLSEAQEAGLESAKAGKKPKEGLASNVPGAPTYNPEEKPMEFKPVNLPDNYNDLSKKDQFDIAKREGLIPKDAVYVPVAAQLMPEEQAGSLGTGQVLRPSGWSYIKQAEADELKATDAELYDVLTTKGYDDYHTLAEKKKDDWERELEKESPELYKIYKEQGATAMQEAVKKINDEYKEWQDKIASGQIIALPDGKYIEKSQFDNLPVGTQKILVAGGFDELDRVTALDWVYKGKIISSEQRSNILQEYDSKKAELIKNGKMFTPEWYNLGGDPRDMMSLDRRSSNRVLTETIAFVFPPYRALLPEYDVKDIKATEWALAGINTVLMATVLLPEAVAASLAGRVIITSLSTAGAGIIGFETARNWKDLSTIEKVMGVGGAVLYSLPLMATLSRGVKVGSSQPIPTTKGEVRAWKGLAIADHPVIGRSDGKWVLGSRNITLPEARLILEGYKPEMMLETKVFVNRSALEKAGFPKEQIDYLELTLKDRNLFAGKKSPSISKEVMLEPTERLTASDVQVVLKKINQYNKSIKQVDMIYGSTTIKSQLSPELRGWRGVHDWDIQTGMDADGTRAFAESLVKDLQKTGKGKYRMSPDPSHPYLVEKYIDGQWEHIADIHMRGESTPSLEIPRSKLDYTGEYSYGRMVAEPAVTVEYPGIGKFDIMSLSESGVRKSDTILRVRQTESGTAFRPPERGIAQLGVPKDAADFYVILRTFKGDAVAEKWLASWADAMGYSKVDLATIMPKVRESIILAAQGKGGGLLTEDILKAWAKAMGYLEDEYDKFLSFLSRLVKEEKGFVGRPAETLEKVLVSKRLSGLSKSMLEVARETPSNLIGYRFTPSKAASGQGKPTATVNIPASLGASVSPSLARTISSPVPIYEGNIIPVSPKLATTEPASPGRSKASPSSFSQKIFTLYRNKTSPSVSSATSADISSPSAQTKTSTSTEKSAAAPSKATSTSTGKSPSKGTSTELSQSPSPGEKPSPDQSQSPSPEKEKSPDSYKTFPSYETESIEVPPPPPPPPTEGESGDEERKYPKGTVAWRQGIGWWVFKPPYNREGDREFVLKEPQGADILRDAKTAIETIQAIGGKAPIDQKFDMGIVDVHLKDPPIKPARDPGRRAIRFKKDKNQTYGGKGNRSRKVGPYYYRGGAVSNKPLN